MFSDFCLNLFTRKSVGRKVQPEGESVATLMWTQMQVPRSMRDFNPNHFVPIISISESISVAIYLSTSSKTYETTISECTTTRSIDSSLPSVTGASLVEFPSVDKTFVSIQSSVAIDESSLDVDKTSVSIQSSVAIDESSLDVVAPLDSSEISTKSEFDSPSKYENTRVSKSESVLDSPGDRNNCVDDTGVSNSVSNLDSLRADSANGVSSESVLVTDVSASSTSTTDSFIQTSDRKTCDHLDGAFL